MQGRRQSRGATLFYSFPPVKKGSGYVGASPAEPFLALPFGRVPTEVAVGVRVGALLNGFLTLSSIIYIGFFGFYIIICVSRISERKYLSFLGN
jgi:hypothetical protein